MMTLYRYAGWSIFAILIVVYLIPSCSHLSGIPFYVLEPMRWMVLLTLLVTDSKNAYVLAITLPLVSSMLTGHPGYVKGILMGAELCLNVFLFMKLYSFVYLYSWRVIVSSALSKMCYYGMKWIVVYFGFLDMNIITTPLWIQGAVVLCIGLVFNFKK
jgi:hypothetical protein